MTRFISHLKQSKKLQAALAVCFWLCAWQAASVAVHSSLILPSPVSVVAALAKLCITADFWRTVAFSCLRMGGGYFAALFCGTALALLAYRVPFLATLLRPLLLTVQSIPVASFTVLALFWLKNAGNLALLIAFLMVLPIVYTNTLAGLRATSRELLEMGRIYRVPRVKLLRYVYLPAVLPHLRAASVVGLGLCWKSGVAAEVIGITNHSIGGQLYNAKVLFASDALLAWTLVIVLIAFTFETLFLKAFDCASARVMGGDGL